MFIVYAKDIKRMEQSMNRQWRQAEPWREGTPALFKRVVSLTVMPERQPASRPLRRTSPAAREDHPRLPMPRKERRRQPVPVILVGSASISRPVAPIDCRSPLSFQLF